MTLFVVIVNVNIYSQSLLWKISGNDLPSASYLYGTIHIKDNRVFEWKDAVYSRLEQCNLLAGEIDLNNVNANEMAAQLFLPEGQTLKTIYSPVDYEMIGSAFKKCSGMDIMLFDRMKPVTLVSVCISAEKEEDMEATVDELIFRYAADNGKPVMGIETIGEQMKLLDAIPYEYITGFFRNIDQQKAEMEKLTLIYQKADLDSIYIMMQEEESGALINDELIRNRNYRMAERTVPIVRRQSVFIAVGAAHLPGEEGLITLYRKEGFIVEPVSIR